MCRAIKTLHNFSPPATNNEIRASSLQFVRKLSGFTKPSRANEEAFNRAVDDVAHAAHHLLESLVTNAPPRNREAEALKAKTRSTKRYGTAEINREVGGAFSLFKGHIVGRSLELVPDQRIVQAWRVVTWPEGTYSIARFELEPQGSGTRLVFDHIGFPEGLHDHLAAGWEENYWSLLKKYFH